MEAAIPVFYEYHLPLVESIISLREFPGIRQFLQGTVDFGASDAPMNNEQMSLAKTPILHIPTVLGATVLAYNLQLSRFDKVICPALTSKHSGSYNSAVQARNFLEPEKQARVFVFDSQNASCGQSLITLKITDLIEGGKSAEEITREIKEFLPKVHFYLMLEDPKWLEASGRINPLVANLLREMIKRDIRISITFKGGKLTPSGIKIGARDIPNSLFKQFEAERKKFKAEGKKIRIAIFHGDWPEGVQRLREMVEKEKNIEVVSLHIIDNVIGAITGPNTLILAWCEI